jgi:hypothetical protein
VELARMNSTDSPTVRLAGRQRARRPKYPFPGVLTDGSYAPRNSDKARLDYLARRPGILKNLKAGVRVTSVDNQWQASVRAALDAAMETERRELRAKGMDPKW